MSGNDRYFTMFHQSKAKKDVNKSVDPSVLSPNKTVVIERKDKIPLMANVLKKITLRHKQLIFIKLLLNSSSEKAKTIICRLMSSTVNHAVNSHKRFGLLKLKGSVRRWNYLLKFTKMLHTLSQSKQKQFKRLTFYTLIRQKLSTLDKKDQKKLLMNNSSLDSKHFERNKSGVLNIPIGLGSREKSSHNLRPATERPGKNNQQSEFEVAKKQYDHLKLMQLSQQAKLALKRVQRYNAKSYPQQVQEICKQVLSIQVKRLQKVKNSNRDMRMLFFDNQLTVTVLAHEMKAIQQLNDEIQQLKKYKQLWDKEEAKRKQKEFKQKQEAKSNKLKHQENVENQMRKFMSTIEELISQKEYDKAINQINNFNKKYEKQSFASDIVYFYKIKSKDLGDKKQYQSCLQEVSKILWTLSMADIKKKKQCLRSLKSNHKEFNFLKTKYHKNQRTYEKKMLNILKHLEDFNNNIIQYLQVSEKLENEKKIPDQSVSRLRNEYESKLLSTEKLYKDQRKKSAVKDNQSTKLSFQKSQLEVEKNEYKEFIENRNKFEKKIDAILDKMQRRIQWRKDYQTLKKDNKFMHVKPFSDFFAFQDASRRFFDDKIKKQVQQFINILESLKNVFHKQKMVHHKRFEDIARILESSGKKDPHLYDLHRAIQLLMVAIVERSKQENQQKHLKKLQNLNTRLASQKKQIQSERNQYKVKVRNLTESRSMMIENNQLTGSRSRLMDSRSKLVDSRSRLVDSRSRLGTDQGLADSRSRINSADKQVGQQLVNQKQLSQKLQMTLNKSSNIILKQGELSEKLSSVEKTFEVAGHKNQNYKKIYEVISNWITFVVSRLQQKKSK